jgi:hypothetical protein
MDRQLKAHPAWGPLSFIPTQDKHWACLLLTEWLDPRFHVSPDEPDDTKLLNKYMGLGRRTGMKNMKMMFDMDFSDPEKKTDSHQRANAAVRAWCRGWVDMHAQDEISPANFLMRVVQRVAASKDLPVALLRATYVFLRYLRMTWADEMAAEHAVYKQERRTLGKKSEGKVVRTLQPRSVYSPTLFIPDYFFANKDEAVAWRAHTYGGTRKAN